MNTCMHESRASSYYSSVRLRRKSSQGPWTSRRRQIVIDSAGQNDKSTTSHSTAVSIKERSDEVLTVEVVIKTLQA